MNHKLCVTLAVAMAALVSIEGIAIAQLQVCSVEAIQARKFLSVSEARAKLKTVTLVKDEFETTAAYNARVDSARSGLPTGPILVAIPDNSLIKYDADSGMAKVVSYSIFTSCLVDQYSLSKEMKSVLFGKPGKFSNSSYCLARMVRSEDCKTYQATNGYGAKLTVKKTYIFREGVYFGSGDSGQNFYLENKSYSSDPVFSFPASVIEARSLKIHSQMLILVQPVAPFTGNGNYYSKPTLNSPRETLIKTDLIVGKPLCFAIGDKQTLKVFDARPAN
jgi:hypothetical protein